MVDLRQDRLAGQAGAVGPLPHLPVHLGGDHHLVPAGELVEGPAEELLAGPTRIHIGRVEEVDPELQGLFDKRTALLLVEHPLMAATRGVAIAHATETDLRDVKAGPAQFDVLHAGNAPLSRVLVKCYADPVTGCSRPAPARSAHNWSGIST